jgi:hypothetical protein
VRDPFGKFMPRLKCSRCGARWKLDLTVLSPPKGHHYTENAGEPCWIRTSDLLIKSQLLYQLS